VRDWRVATLHEPGSLGPASIRRNCAVFWARHGACRGGPHDASRVKTRLPKGSVTTGWCYLDLSANAWVDLRPKRNSQTSDRKNCVSTNSFPHESRGPKTQLRGTVLGFAWLDGSPWQPVRGGTVGRSVPSSVGHRRRGLSGGRLLKYQR